MIFKFDDYTDDCRGYFCPGGRCIDPVYVCNGIYDCPDGSDENGCKFNTETAIFNLVFIIKGGPE